MKQQELLDATVNFPFITGVYLSDKDFRGDFDLSGTDFEANYNTYYNDTLKNKELEKSSQMYVGYKFKIPDGTNINNGDQFVMNIPTFGKKDFNLDFKQPPFVEANPEITKDGSY